MSSNISTDTISSDPTKCTMKAGKRWPVELRWFRKLRPRIHPWVEVTPRPEGGAGFYDFIMSTRFNLNQTAYMIVERMCTGEQTLGEIAAELAEKFGRDEHEILTAVVRIYKQLESNDAIAYPMWRYCVLYVSRARKWLQRAVDVFMREFFRGLGGQ